MINTVKLTEHAPRALPTASVDLDAIAHNVATLREHAGSAAVMAVVKADGYGHGATPVARAALAAGAAELGVATVDEALALRRDGITAPVLAWLHPPDTDFGPALLADVQLGVSSERQVDDVARRRPAHRPDRDGHRQSGHRSEPQRGRAGRLSGDARRRCGGPSRRRRDAGARHHVAPGARRRSRPSAQRPAGAAADRHAGRRPATRASQFEVVHLSNSPAAMTRPDLAFDMVRPGIAVYGQTPIPERGDLGLRPAMTVKCPVALVRSAEGRRRRVLRAHLDRRARHHAWRWSRSATPTGCSAR